jgi:hypothetical protein
LFEKIPCRRRPAVPRSRIKPDTKPGPGFINPLLKTFRVAHGAK